MQGITNQHNKSAGHAQILLKFVDNNPKTIATDHCMVRRPEGISRDAPVVAASNAGVGIGITPD